MWGETKLKGIQGNLRNNTVEKRKRIMVFLCLWPQFLSSVLNQMLDGLWIELTLNLVPNTTQHSSFRGESKLILDTELKVSLLWWSWTWFQLWNSQLTFSSFLLSQSFFLLDNCHMFEQKKWRGKKWVTDWYRRKSLRKTYKQKMFPTSQNLYGFWQTHTCYRIAKSNSTLRGFSDI